MSKSPKSILPPSVHPLVRLLHELRDRLSTEKPEVPWWLVQMISMILPVYWRRLRCLKLGRDDDHVVPCLRTAMWLCILHDMWHDRLNTIPESSTFLQREPQGSTDVPAVPAVPGTPCHWPQGAPTVVSSLGFCQGQKGWWDYGMRGWDSQVGWHLESRWTIGFKNGQVLKNKEQAAQALHASAVAAAACGVLCAGEALTARQVRWEGIRRPG